ncbi:MAG: radical SAM protein [Thermoleophilia bacterium]|nr:radical SAM protein [Thermoleophilia bacterium]
MLNVTALLGRPSATDDLRYGHGSRLRSGAERRPVVVWNCTRSCNLSCRHCYSDSTAQRYDELTTDEAMEFLDDIAAFGSPALLLSGGEPFMRPDLLEVMTEARSRGLAVTISSNGTMVTPERARAVAAAGVRYVGISVDGLEADHDAFRGRRGAYRRSLAGIAALKAEGVRVGVRVTLTATAIAALPDIFAMIEREGIDRACFYHLVPAGRGVSQEAVAPPGVRAAVESIFAWSEDLVERDAPVEVLTVDNYADGPALYLRELGRDPEVATRIHERLSWNGGARNASGTGLAAVDWEGRVKPDQFWGGPVLGSVRERPLSQIWTDPPPELERLRRRSDNLTGRCSGCRFLGLCGGGLASRALASGAGLEGSDPGCHLRDEEIAAVA